MHACMRVCMYACMYVFRYVCMYAYMYACMHACMYMYMHMYMYICLVIRINADHAVLWLIYRIKFLTLHVFFLSVANITMLMCILLSGGRKFYFQQNTAKNRLQKPIVYISTVIEALLYSSSGRQKAVGLIKLATNWTTHLILPTITFVTRMAKCLESNSHYMQI